MSSYYMRKSTYQKDFNKRAPEYDRHGMIRNMDYNKAKFDDPMWQRGRNESSEQYEDRLREMSKHQAPDFYPTYEARKAHEMHEYGRERRPQHEAHHDGPMTDRRGYGDMDRGRGYEDGSQTDRGYNRTYLDHGNLTYRRHDRRDDPKYDRYRPTQKDYGDFETTPKLDNMPKPYRGQFDKQIDYKSTGNIEPVSKPESGVYLFIRTHKDALSDIKTSFQKHKTMLNQSGMLTGISTRVRITGDYSNWQLKRGPAFEDHGVTEYDTDYIVIVLWFPNAKAAKYWIDYDKDFKGASFPAPYGRDMVIVPINYIPPEDGSCRTFLLTEYPAVKHPDYFRTDIIEPMRDILRDYNCEPFVVRTNNASVDRSSWIGTGSTLAVHRFPSDTEAQRFLTDPRARNLRGKLNGVTKGGRHTTVKFTITDLV